MQCRAVGAFDVAVLTPLRVRHPGAACVCNITSTHDPMVATQAALSGTGAGMILVVPTPLASGKQLATTTRDRKRGNMKTSIVGLACTALLCSGAATAHADAIAVSDGLISTDFVRDVRVDLVSDLFTLNLVGSAN